MTPDQQKAARAYKRRQAWHKWLADREAEVERNLHMYLTFLGLCIAALLIAFWPY